MISPKIVFKQSLPLKVLVKEEHAASTGRDKRLN